jgi:hypothetical protein
MKKHVATIDGRVTTIDGRFARTDRHVVTIDGRAAKLDHHDAAIDGRFAAVDQAFASRKLRVGTFASRVGNVSLSRAQHDSPKAMQGRLVA